MATVATITQTIVTLLDTEAVGAKTVQAGYGGIGRVLQQPRLMPALVVVYSGGRFDERTRSGRESDASRTWTIFAIVADIMPGVDAAGEAAACLERATARLQGQVIDGGELWPSRDTMIEVPGAAVYALDVTIDTRTSGL